MDVSERQAGRLVMTEAAAISSVVKKDCFQELDMEKFQFIATLDRHISELCQSMDGKYFKMSEYQIGVNVPPLHCWCRSCMVLYFGDEFTEREQRAARNEEGKTYYVPANMTYKEWKERFINNSNISERQTNQSVTDYIVRSHIPDQDVANENQIVEEVILSMPQKVRDALEQGTIIDIGKEGASQYDYVHDILYVAKEADKTEVIHEIGHMVENKLLDSQKVAKIRKKIVGEVSIFRYFSRNL